MELQGFNSIFEIFATFTLAYIIIDELVENPYISVISEKVLRVYKPIHDVFSQIRSQIDGRKTSLNNITQSDFKHERIQQDLPKIKGILDSIKERSDQSYQEIKFIIRQKHATRVFVYLNCYLFFYCLTVLFYGGLYNQPVNEAGTLGDRDLDNSLFVFNVCAMLFLLFGWCLDKQKKEGKIEEKKNNFYIVSNMLNGYLLSFCCYLVAIVLSMLACFLDWEIINFSSRYPHSILVMSCVFIPVSNFLIYIFKARKRAKKSLPDLQSRADIFNKDYTNDLSEIDDFLGMYNHLKRSEISITE